MMMIDQSTQQAKILIANTTKKQETKTKVYE